MIGLSVRTILLLVGLLAGLSGCASRSYHEDIPEPQAPQSRSAPSSLAANTYAVKPGDSLHSIAFAAGTDWQTLAELNRIRAPFTIYPGQVLKLSASAVPVTLGMEPDGPARPPAAPDAVAPIAPAAPPVATAPATPPVVASAPRPLPPPPANPGAWRWPSGGKLIAGFSNAAQPHKGIDIAGNTGDPVLAAKGGTVVYAGNGVRGYGNLLIVKHDALFLSAYAHNSKLLVREGDVVKGGQQIAEMGDSGTDRTKLHFEVRKQGNPVDPLQVLPRR